MTTPAITAPDAASRARAAVGLALGVLAPEALALGDGRVRLNAHEQLDRDAVRRLDERLARRAATQVSDEQLVVEAVALLGAELDHARGGVSPVDGATQALDDLLDVPDLSDSMRDETRAMLRTVLEGNELTTDSALQRLAAERAKDRTEGQPPLVADTVEAARAISREAEIIARPSTATVRTPRRHRRTVGTRHRRVGMPDFTRSDESRRTASTLGDLSRAEAETAALNALLQVHPSDLSTGVTEPMRLISRPQVGVVSTADGPQHFRVEVGEPPRGLVAQATMRAGSLTDPHVVRISPRLETAQLPRVWTSQVSRVLQDVEAQATAPTSLLGRFRASLGSRRA